MHFLLKMPNMLFSYNARPVIYRQKTYTKNLSAEILLNKPFLGIKTLNDKGKFLPGLFSKLLEYGLVCT